MSKKPNYKLPMTAAQAWTNVQAGVKCNFGGCQNHGLNRFCDVLQSFHDGLDQLEAAGELVVAND